MKVLVVDVGGTHVKILSSGHRTRRKFRSGPNMTPQQMVSAVQQNSQDWEYDVVSIGYPGPVRNGVPLKEPYNLAPGWLGFDFQAAFRRRVKVVNDAAMQALGSYKNGRMLFLGFGTGLGSTLILEGVVAPMELGHLPYRRATFEDYVGRSALQKSGVVKWRQDVADVVGRLIAALLPDDIVLGGGNAEFLKTLPPNCRLGSNANAFTGGFRLWETEKTSRVQPIAKVA